MSPAQPAYTTISNLTSSTADAADISCAEHTAKAVRYADHAVAIREEAFGKQHPQVAAVLLVLGRIQCLQQNRARAVELYETAQRILVQRFGAHHQRVLQAERSRINAMALLK